MAQPAEWRYFEATFASDALDPEMAISPWAGHRRFAYDLVRWLAPRTVVELGTERGCSFFALCQAAHDGDLPSEISAVDTWRGDEHAGHYGEEVFDSVRRILAERFAGGRFHLIRKSFDEAASAFGDGTIDLFHLDGFHSYEASRHDFETWLPKLADDGLMLFHDVAPDCGYGSAQLWAELRAHYPSFTFAHGWGLGLLFPKGAGRHEELTRQGFDDKMLVYRHRAEHEAARASAERDLAWQRAQTDLQWRRAEAATVRAVNAEQELALVRRERDRVGARGEELAVAVRQRGEAIAELETLERSVAVRLSRGFDRFPRVKSAVITVANRLLP